MGFADGLRLRHRLGGYREYAPPSALIGVSESCWIHRGPSEEQRGPAVHRVLPDPALSLAFVCRRDADGGVAEPRLVVIGEKTQPRIFTYESRDEIAAVRLKLEWVRAVLGISPADHRDATDDWTLIAPPSARALLDRLAGTRSAAEALAIVSGEVRDAAARASAAPPAAARWALDVVRASRGRARIGVLADGAGLSPRHLRRIVGDHTGVGLKGYARTVRFVTAIVMADGMAAPDWAGIAARAGYCDQSHLVRDCHAICGMSPGRLDRERRAQRIPGHAAPSRP